MTVVRTNSIESMMTGDPGPLRRWAETGDFRLNTSGIEPTEYRIVILPDPVEEKTKGGVYIPENVRERHQEAATRGVLVACGEWAFTESAERRQSKPPAVGDRVLISKYAGVEAEGADGKKYRVCNDKDLLAVLC